ncbi:phosphoribosyl-ATP diphosphatase [Halolamina sp.]|uniref:phosphoribosyl-ATP diphosphatase n=1 Tax=Halolamina sp. TaxID=1940283 RepID=UPI000223BE69|nr:Phosphoribosyl-ATP pyrophosphatase [halophilic archaeon DL31]
MTDANSDAVLEELFATIESRKAELPEGSYTTSLFTHEKGENAVLEKLGEESTEILLAAKDDDTEELAHESADFLYHLLVLLSMKEMEPEDVLAELESRF